MKAKTNPINWHDLHAGIEIDIPTKNPVNSYLANGTMTDLWNSKVTIYNDIQATLSEERHFDSFIIDLCNIQGGYVAKTNGTIQNVVNAQTVITKDIVHYKSPLEYTKLPINERENYYTVQVGDYIVFDEIDDVVATAQDFAHLQQKYKNNGIKVTSVSVNVNGMSVDNITMTNA